MGLGEKMRRQWKLSPQILDRTPLWLIRCQLVLYIKCVFYFVSLQGLYQLLEASVVIRTRRADVANVKVSLGNVVHMKNRPIVLCSLYFKTQEKLTKMEPRKMLLWLWMNKSSCHQKGK